MEFDGSLGPLFFLFTILRKCGVSCKYDGWVVDIWFIWCSTYTPMFYVIETDTLIIGLTGGIIACAL